MVGHDAFESRHGDMNVLANTKNYEIIKEIRSLQKTELDVKFESVHCSNLIFIGSYKEIGSGEFEYYIKAPEVIYGLTSLLDDIVEILPIIKKKDCTKLTKLFNQDVCIWTFAPDCACCG